MTPSSQKMESPTIPGQFNPTCSDTLDNDCDGYVDIGESVCCDCFDNDGDGYGNPACENCTYPELDCDDNDQDVNPEATEGPVGDPTCGDGLDNDCDGLLDGVDGECVGTSPMAQTPAGCFEMGDHFAEGGYYELPVHNVCISAFEMDVHEVTNAEYKACVDVGQCTAPELPSSVTRDVYYGNPAYNDFPVLYVAWPRARNYCTWAGKRLPTEAEWEYAARGGLAGKRYPWGDAISGTDANYLWSGDPWDNDTSPVGYYAANGYGLYDMAGNVSEWVNDWFSDTYYQYCVDKGIVYDPPGPASYEEGLLVRGGLWSSYTDNLRVAYRHTGIHAGNKFTGFRCAR